MKLTDVLDRLNSLEKTPFLKVIESLRTDLLTPDADLEKVLNEIDSSGLKSADSMLISELFSHLEENYKSKIKSEFVNISSQLDFLIDIIIRDGNCIMSQDWFSVLYKAELKSIKNKSKILIKSIETEDSNLTEEKLRDYKIYISCLKTAYFNDVSNNRDPQISSDELSILITLSESLDLSQEEVKLINYSIVQPKLIDIDKVVKFLKDLGVVLYSRKENTVYVPDEIVRVLRQVRGKQIADKYLRRVLKLLKEPKVNLICRSHNIDTKLSLEQKVKSIINEGISLKSILTNGIHKKGVNVTTKKKFLNDFWNKSLLQNKALKGTTLDDKINSVILYFSKIEKDDKVGISIDGYERLLIDLSENLPKLNERMKDVFELQQENVMSSSLLIDYNIKPRDVLDIIDKKDIEKFCEIRGISLRGNEYKNILKEYKDYDNLYLENYEHVGYRNLNKLKENGIKISESDIGLKFEDLTRDIFSQLGFNVDEQLRKSLNTRKDKADIFLNLGNNELILVECKSVKESGYNKFSSVSRQMISYAKNAKANDYSIIKSLLVSPEFSDDFINDTINEFDLNLSLIKASTLIKILNGFKENGKHEVLPYKLLMRDVVISEERVLKALNK